jgi:hypothetical protein
LVALAKIPLGMFFFLIQKKCAKEIEGSFGILEKFEMKISKLINYLVDMCYSCATTTYKACQIGLGVGVQKKCYGQRNCWIWFLLILSELKIKFVTWFGCRFVRILKDQWKW